MKRIIVLVSLGAQQLVCMNPVLNVQPYREKLVQVKACVQSLDKLLALDTMIHDSIKNTATPTQAFFDTMEQKMSEYGILLTACERACLIVNRAMQFTHFDTQLKGYKAAVVQKKNDLFVAVRKQLDDLVATITSSFKNAQYSTIPHDFSEKAPQLLQLIIHARSLKLDVKVWQDAYDRFFALKKNVDDLVTARTAFEQAKKAFFADPSHASSLEAATSNFLGALRKAQAYRTSCGELCS